MTISFKRYLEHNFCSFSKKLHQFSVSCPPPAFMEGLVVFGGRRPPHFRKWGGRAHHPFLRKMGGANFFENVCMPVSGAFLGCFLSFNHPKSSKFSSLAPSALASHSYTFLAGGALKNNAFVSPFVWRYVLLGPFWLGARAKTTHS